MEIFVHFLIWTAAVFYGLYNVFLQTSSVDIYSINELTDDFEEGWLLIGRLKDVSDYEWKTWKLLVKSLIPWLALNFCGAELLRQKNINIQLWYIFVSFSFIIYQLGLASFLLLISQPFIYFFILKFGGKTKSIWFTCCMSLVVINILKKDLNINHENFHFNFLLMVSSLWILLRCLSFSLDFVYTKYENDKELNTIDCMQLLNFISFTFYLPVLFFGPVLLYDNYLKSLNYQNHSSLQWRLYCLIRNSTRYIGWIIFIDFSSHFIYFNAIQNYPEIVEAMPEWCLYGCGLWMGLYFYIKYLVAYGMAGTIAALDHFEPEIPPRCIARIHLYSQMWKYFDVALYKFLLRYIYKPALQGIDKKDVMRLTFVRIFISFICFAFVFFWHGIEKFVFIWTSLNYVGIVMENIGHLITQSNIYKKFKNFALKSEKMNDRFNALVASPLLAMSCISNFYFFAGSDIGDIYAHRVWHQSFNCFIIMFICLYSFCRVSQFVENISARRVLT